MYHPPSIKQLLLQDKFTEISIKLAAYFLLNNIITQVKKGTLSTVQLFVIHGLCYQVLICSHILLKTAGSLQQ